MGETIGTSTIYDESDNSTAVSYISKMGETIGTSTIYDESDNSTAVSYISKMGETIGTSTIHDESDNSTAVSYIAKMGGTIGTSTIYDESDNSMAVSYGCVLHLKDGRNIHYFWLICHEGPIRRSFHEVTDCKKIVILLEMSIVNIWTSNTVIFNFNQQNSLVF